MNMFVYGFLTALAAYLFLKFIAMMAPLGDPETGFGRREFREGRTRSQVKLPGTNQELPPPPPPPPSRAIHPLLGETKASVREGEDWLTYMSGYAHGMAVARATAERVQP